MRRQTTLLGGAALGTLLAFGLVAGAQAKATRHYHAQSAGDAALKAEVASLKAALADVDNRLNDEVQARQALQSQTQAAQAAAQAAQADADAAHQQLAEQIQTIPGSVQTQINTAIAAAKPKPSWADNTRLGGEVFGDLSYISQEPRPNKINGVGFDVKRAYLSVDHAFNDVYSANVTVDLAPNGIILNGGTFGTGTLQGSEAVKYAYVQAHYADFFIVQLGAEKTPWIPFVDDVAGYRYIDKHIVDQNKYGNSSDWGANVSGSWDKGLINYSLMASDGAGYKNPVRSTTMDFEGRVNVNYQGFVAAVGGYDGNISDAIEGTTPYQSVSRLDALFAYSNKTFRLGGEWFQAWDWKTPTGSAAVAAIASSTTSEMCEVAPSTTFEPCKIETLPVAAVPASPPKSDRSMGYSFWASYNFMPQWSVFARYDGLDPSQILDPREHYDYVNAGIQYEPVQNLDLALVYKHEDISHAIKGGYGDATTTLAPGSTLTYNTKTGVYTPGTGSSSGSFDEFGIYTRFKF